MSLRKGWVGESRMTVAAFVLLSEPAAELLLPTQAINFNAVIAKLLLTNVKQVQRSTVRMT